MLAWPPPTSRSVVECPNRVPERSGASQLRLERPNSVPEHSGAPHQRPGALWNAPTASRNVLERPNSVWQVPERSGAPPPREAERFRASQQRLAWSHQRPEALWNAPTASWSVLERPHSVWNVPTASRSILKRPTNVPERCGTPQQRPRAFWSVPTSSGKSWSVRERPHRMRPKSNLRPKSRPPTSRSVGVWE